MIDLKKISHLRYLAIGFFLTFFLISIIDAGVFFNRMNRLAPNIAALLILIFSLKIKPNKYILGFLFLILFSSIAAFGYEIFFLRELTIVFNFVGYFTLGYSVIPKISSLKANLFLKLYFFIALLVIVYLLSQLLYINKERYDSTLDYILFIISNISFVFAIATAILYVHYSPNKKSILFFIIVIVFIFSEIARFALYYSEEYFEFLYYSCRLLYVLGLSLLLYYCGNKNEVSSSIISEGK
jgi:hypothetical protein